jgi:hypothetical protein
MDQALFQQLQLRTSTYPVYSVTWGRPFKFYLWVHAPSSVLYVVSLLEQMNCGQRQILGEMKQKRRGKGKGINQFYHYYHSLLRCIVVFFNVHFSLRNNSIFQGDHQSTFFGNFPPPNSRPRSHGTSFIVIRFAPSVKREDSLYQGRNQGDNIKSMRHPNAWAV